MSSVAERSRRVLRAAFLLCYRIYYLFTLTFYLFNYIIIVRFRQRAAHTKGALNKLTVLHPCISRFWRHSIDFEAALGYNNLEREK